MKMFKTLLAFPIWLAKTFLYFFMMVIGWFIGPVLLMFRNGSKLKYFDNIFGNSIDGLCGDSAYRSHEALKWYAKYWPCYWWAFIRNPVNNLIRSLGPKGIVQSISKHGNLTLSTIDGNVYWLYHVKKNWNSTYHWEVKFGYRLWDDDRINSKFVVGRYFENAIVCMIQPIRRT